MNKEKEFIKIIKETLNLKEDNNIKIGIGDDAAIVSGLGDQIVCSDSIIEGVHFDLNYFSLEDVGWKSIAINQSDIASMGGEPKFFTVSCGFPKNFTNDDVKKIAKGIKSACDNNGGKVVGGDIILSEKIFISISSIGEIHGNNFMTRSSAKPGEKIAVTGTLGNSAAGLKLIKDGIKENIFSSFHLRPAPKIKTGVLLSKNGINCCMDISDGLHNDLINLCDSSKVSALIKIENIPVSGELKNMFPDNYHDIAINGGEDFELLFTFNDLPKDLLDEIIIIGEVKEINSNQIEYNLKGNKYTPNFNVWRHFE